MKNVKEELKEEGLITKTNRLSPKAIRVLNEKTGLLQRVVEQTSFLQYNASIKVRLQCILQDIKEQPLCIVCSNPVEMRTTGRFVNTFPTYCGSKCFSSQETVQNKRRNTNIKKYGSSVVLQTDRVKQIRKEKNLERYGVENSLNSPIVREQIKQTNLERYGVENTFSSKEIRERIKKTNLERYGVENTLANKDIREQIKQTNLEKYGVENPFHNQKDIREKFKEKHGKDFPIQVKEIREKFHSTMRERYGNSNYHISQIDSDSLEKLNDKEWLHDQHHNEYKTITKIAEELNVSPSMVRSYFNKHGIDILTHTSSQGERDVADFIRNNYDKQVITNTKQLITPYEVDIYLPDINIAIEFDGIFWHSELNGKDKNYHLNKTKMCEEKGVRLIHLWQNEWEFKNEIVKARLINLLQANPKKVPARKTKVVELTPKEAADFLNQTHIQLSCSSSIRYGLIHDNKLVSVMTFGKSRFSKKYDYELLRFANARGVSVVGGASKLFKHFIREHQPSTVISYSDKRWNTGQLYQKLGFEYLHSARPNYFYFYKMDYANLFSRVKFQKHKLGKQLEIFDPNLTEWQNMQLNEYDRIWDCGNSVWCWSGG